MFTEALVALSIRILVVPWGPAEAGIVPFWGQGAWCYSSHALRAAVTQPFSNSALTQMWSSKADANYYANSIIVAFSCCRRFIASHNPINHSKSLEFLRYKEEISAVALAEPEKTWWIRRQVNPSAKSSLQPPVLRGFLPLDHITLEVWTQRLD